MQPSQILRAARTTRASAFRANPTFFTQQAQSFIFRSTKARFAGFRREGGKRWQSSGAGGTGATGAGTAPDAEAGASWAKKLWDSPVGMKTVHFWAPVMKWALVIAGIGDFYRPAEKLSLTQNFALTCTGLIWTRWCFVIKPRNILLAAVNFFLGMVGVIQVSRILMYNSSQKKLTASEQLGAAKDSTMDAAKGVKGEVESAAKKM